VSMRADVVDAVISHTLPFQAYAWFPKTNN